MAHQEHRMSTSEPQTITFVLLAYNQEKYIAEAIKGALSQTYTPLEIIFSDDCSNDQTFKIIEKIVKNYNGPHKIRLNRNITNIGLISHVNKVNDMCSPGLVIVAAGDDISTSDRTERIVQEWSENPKSTSFHSSVIKIDSEGHLGDAWKTPKANFASLKDYMEFSIIIGATHAWHTDVHKFFGPITTHRAREDRIVAARSAMKFGVTFIDEPLVHYRTNGMSNSNYGASHNTDPLPEAEMRMSELSQAIIDSTKAFPNDSKNSDLIAISAQKILAQILSEINQRKSFRFYLDMILQAPIPYVRLLLKYLQTQYLSAKNRD
jgi:glycosyltransferase involved in cell wall biosynthesis